MDEKTSCFAKPELVFSSILVLSGVVIGAVTLVLSASLGFKGFITALLCFTAVAILCTFVCTTHYNLFFLSMATLSLPLGLDFHILYKDTPYVQLRGLPVTLFDLFFLLLLMYWFLQIISRKATVRIVPSISFPALAYIGIAGISALHSQDRTLSLCMLLLIIKGYLIFIYFANNVTTNEQIAWIIVMLGIGILMQSGIGFLQYFTGGRLGLEILGEYDQGFREIRAGSAIISRVGGTMGVNNLPMYLNFFMPLFLCLLFTNISFKYKLGAGLVLLLGGITEILTFSRGGWLSLTVGITIALYGILKQKLKSHLKSAFLVGTVILITVTILLGISQDVRHRVFGNDHGSALSRISMIQVALRMITENPLQGVGLNSYAAQMNRYDHTRQNISYRFPFPVHNTFLLIAAESGIPALLSFLILLFGSIRMSLLFFQVKDRFCHLVGIGFSSGFLSWMIHAQFEGVRAGIYTPPWFSIAMIAALHQMVVLYRTSSDAGKSI